MSARRQRSAAPDQPGLILVDDDPVVRETLAFVLGDDFTVYAATNRPEARAFSQGNSAPLALVDLGLPPQPHRPDEGLALTSELLLDNPTMKVLILSGQTTRDHIQHALSLGAVDFVPKPCDTQLLKARLRHQLLLLDAELASGAQVRVARRLVGDSRAVRELRADVSRYAKTDFAVLIEGESGSGKELVAELLHEQSARASQPFLTVNCAAFNRELLEAQLFGHARGAFTGAANVRTGFFEDADNGTLFLDEIGELPLDLQPKLLRVLENGQYYRLGETRPRNANVRIVAATNRNLAEETRGGRFRNDLYHRLRVLTVRVPSLRERGGDSLLLLDHFRALYQDKIRPFTLDDEARERWLDYPFPGSVRELRNIVIRLGAKYPGQRIGLAELEPELDVHCEADEPGLHQLNRGGFHLDETLGVWERRYIKAALRLSKGNLSEAARMLGLNRTTLYSRIQRLSGRSV